MDGNHEYKQAQGVNHYQRFDGFKSSYIEFMEAIPDATKGPQIIDNNSDATGNNEHNTNNEPTAAFLFKMLLFSLAVCAVLVLFALLLAHLVRDSAPYYLEATDNYKMQMKTKEYGIEFYVKSIDKFNEKYPEGTPARATIEKTIVDDYIRMERIYCSHEIWLHAVNPENLTPECDKLQSKGIHI